MLLGINITGCKTRNEIISAISLIIDALKLRKAKNWEISESLIGSSERFCNDLTYAGKDMKYTVRQAQKELKRLYDLAELELRNNLERKDQDWPQARNQR